MMSKSKAGELENSRQFMAELITEFIGSAELYEICIETESGSVSLRKYDSPQKIGFTPRSDKQ